MNFKIPHVILIACMVGLLMYCTDKATTADTVIINATIATIDKNQAEAIAIKDDRIFKLGSTAEINKLVGKKTKVIDAKDNFVMPGFIEGHGHFSGLGQSLINLNFLQSKTWSDVVDQVAQKVKKANPGEWIEGRGWHQEKWVELPEHQFDGYPFHDKLSSLSPENPVILFHASGHSLFANAKAMEIAGISLETPNPRGGKIIRDNQGVAVGVFEERAMQPIRDAYQSYLDSISEKEKTARWLKGIELAEQECIKKGITSFQDAGSTFDEIDRYKELAESGQLDLRLWVMIRESYNEMKNKLSNFPIINAGNHFLTVKAIKSEVDGALGAFGAWLLRPYNDKPNFTGQNTTSISEVKNIAKLARKHNLQLCIHAIGDRANREVLNIMENNLSNVSEQRDLRWRIEHAQHLSVEDIPRFKELGIIASMQGIHCTSDAPFVVKRLGEERSRTGAYPWRSLLDNGVVIANGTDAPVEDVDPILNFYASVTRKRVDNQMAFFPEQKMTREEALYSYTLGNAFAAFEEKDKGSITEGKLADIVILSNNLLTCGDEDILNTKVLYTIIGGAIKYEKL